MNIGQLFKKFQMVPHRWTDLIGWPFMEPCRKDRLLMQNEHLSFVQDISNGAPLMDRPNRLAIHGFVLDG
jgi:hypothetical protein